MFSSVFGSKWVGLVAGTAFSLVVHGCLVGCSQSTKDQRDNLATLERGNFKGRISLQSDARVGGSFTGPGFYVGPERSSLFAEGEVDFSQHKGDETPLSDEVPASDQPAPEPQ